MRKCITEERNQHKRTQRAIVALLPSGKFTRLVFDMACRVELCFSSKSPSMKRENKDVLPTLPEETNAKSVSVKETSIYHHFFRALFPLEPLGTFAVFRNRFSFRSVLLSKMNVPSPRSTTLNSLLVSIFPGDIVQIRIGGDCRRK